MTISYNKRGGNKKAVTRNRFGNNEKPHAVKEVATVTTFSDSLHEKEKDTGNGNREKEKEATSKKLLRLLPNEENAANTGFSAVCKCYRACYDLLRKLLPPRPLTEKQPLNEPTQELTFPPNEPKHFEEVRT